MSKKPEPPAAAPRKKAPKPIRRMDYSGLNFSGPVRRVATVVPEPTWQALDEIVFSLPLTVSRLVGILVEARLVEKGILKPEDSLLAKFEPQIFDEYRALRSAR